MKILCECGATILDQADQLPHKAHFVADQDWEQMLEAIDEAIEATASGARSWEAACMRIRQWMGAKSRSAWQCGACGRIYLDDRAYVARAFVPESEETSREIFRAEKN